MTSILLNYHVKQTTSLSVVPRETVMVFEHTLVPTASSHPGEAASGGVGEGL